MGSAATSAPQDASSPAVVVIELTRSQILRVCQEAEGAEADADLLDGPNDDVRNLGAVLNVVARDPGSRFSSSLVTGLYVLASLPDDGKPVGIIKLAEHLEMPKATLHRYLQTLVVAELVQRNEKTREYSRAPALVSSPALAVEDK